MGIPSMAGGADMRGSGPVNGRTFMFAFSREIRWSLLGYMADSVIIGIVRGFLKHDISPSYGPARLRVRLREERRSRGGGMP